MDNLQERVDALERLCNRTNNDLISLQAVAAALQQRDFITGATPVTEGKTVVGYVIEFSKSPAVTIYHGKEGEDGAMPRIGVREDSDGDCCWTVEGEWLTDGEGRKVKAGSQDGKDGITPQLKIEDGYWHVSYNRGDS